MHFTASGRRQIPGQRFVVPRSGLVGLVEEEEKIAQLLLKIRARNAGDQFFIAVDCFVEMLLCRAQLREVFRCLIALRRLLKRAAVLFLGVIELAAAEKYFAGAEAVPGAILRRFPARHCFIRGAQSEAQRFVVIAAEPRQISPALKNGR